MRRIILASASPRRREIMAQAGYQFEVQASLKEERPTAIRPDEIVKELALSKALDVADRNVRKNLIVIGADTVVSCHDEIFGKPESKDDAYRMLFALQGSRHEVYTGVAILDYDENGRKKVINHAVRTFVYVNRMSDAEIREYIENGHVFDKAGSYAIQGSFAVHIRKIDGDYYNVVGLPISYIYGQLKKLQDSGRVNCSMSAS